MDPAAGTVYVVNNLAGTVSVIAHPVITTTSPLPPGTAGTPYTTTLHVAGGIAPWTWAITGGSLPAGPRHRMTKRLQTTAETFRQPQTARCHSTGVARPCW